jgi:5-methyltetrahydrofolate--homocysteine methyltransferase
MDFEGLKEIVIKGRFREIEDTVKAGLNEGVDPEIMLDKALVPAMEEVGRCFSNCEIFIPEMMVSAKVMEMALALINPLLASRRGQAKRGKFAIGTVKDDLHDIGKNIVCAMMQGGGFEVDDLGVDCPPERFIEAIKAGNKLIGLSAILTTVLANVKKTIEAIERAGLRNQVRIMVGGVALNHSIAREMGADAYCEDAGVAVVRAKELCAFE